MFDQVDNLEISVQKFSAKDDPEDFAVGTKDRRGSDKHHARSVLIDLYRSGQRSIDQFNMGLLGKIGGFLTEFVL